MDTWARERTARHRSRLMAIGTAVLAVALLGSCSHGSSADAFCEKIRAVPTPHPQDALPVAQQIRILNELETVAPKELRADLHVYLAEAELIASGKFRGSSFPPSEVHAFLHLSKFSGDHCGRDPFSPSCPGAPNAP